jgi:general secretion pathway protein A
MYSSYFGFKESPFNLTPDSKYFYLSRQHREALTYLLYGIHERKGFIVLTGDIGTGKTTICRSLLAHLNDSVDTALIFNSFMSDVEILETVTREFGLPRMETRGTVKDYIDALNEFLLANFAAGRTSVLIIDEAQNLSHSALEQIRMISNLETEKEKLIQIVLIGQPELKKILASPSLKQLNERITVRYDLQPLGNWEIREYIRHRITVAGEKIGVKFSDGAHARIYRYSRGNPRRVNAVCDRALLIAYSKNSNKIDKKTIDLAIKDLRRVETPKIWEKKRIISFAVILIIVAGGAILATLRFEDLMMLFRTYLTW